MKGKTIWIMNHYATNMFFNRGGRHYWFARNLDSNGYEPVIFCANVAHETNRVVDIKKGNHVVEQVDTIPFVFVKTCKAKGNGLDRIINMVLFAHNLYLAAKTYAARCGEPDVILASSPHPLTMIAGIRLAEKFGVPCICEIRDLWPEAIFAFDKAREDSTLGKVLLAGEHWIYKKADAIIFTMEGGSDYIKEKKWDIAQGGDIDLGKCYHINNGVDVSGFDELAKNKILHDPDLSSDKFNVVYVGSIRPMNNVENILDAASLLKDNDDIQFLIFGDGSERERLEEKVKAGELFNVKFKGFINKQLVPYVLSKSSVNILNYSSTQYNWTRGSSSNKLFEYMASGKPIISTIRPGYSIIERYNCGIELENGTAEELATAILQVKNMSKGEYDRLGHNARLGAQDFDFSVLTKKLIDIIEKVIVEDSALEL